MSELSESTRTAIRLTFITVVVLACIAGLVLAVQRTRRGDPEPTISGDNTIVELLTPANGDEVVGQHQVAIDLTVAWTGVLVINDVEIPEADLTRRPELGQIIFQPDEDKVYERLPAGQVCVEAILWRVGQARSADSRTVDWCFQVA
ncbi:MAG: hypothetical protein ACRD0U_02800 [Acidimicrobiales bacterium]